MDKLASFWRDRPTFVTGGTGLVGSWLLKRLNDAGAEVVCLVRDSVPQSEASRSGALGNIRVVTGSVCDYSLLERVINEYEIRTVFHLAAQTIVGTANRNPLSTFETNIQGTWSLLEACRRNSTVEQLIVASSDKAYGTQANLPYDENTPLAGLHPYDVSKSCTDLLTQTYANTYKLPAVITRCGNFYGGGDLNWNRIVPGTIRSMIRGESPVIRSDGSYVRDYFYVEDGAAAYMLLAEKLAEDPTLVGEAFNFSYERKVTVLGLVQMLARLMKSPLTPDVRNEAKNEIKHQYLSSQKARTRLGWSPHFDLELGLQRTVDWYREFLRHS